MVTESQVSPNGIIIVSYERAGEVKLDISLSSSPALSKVWAQHFVNNAPSELNPRA